MAASLLERRQAQTPCQFSGEACSTESNHYRKVISHIFGRNKKCTVGIPQYVWIYYCRKHYQRARYRTAEWPFRQCDLAVDTIQNMRAWGGVESFNLQLRRRETWRTGRPTNENNSDSENDKGDQDEDMPDVKSEDNESGELSPSTVTGAFTPINTAPHTTSRPAKAGVSEYEGDEQGGNKTPLATAPTGTATRTKTTTKKKRSPTIIPHPVPDWLQTRVGSNKPFDEILSVLHDLRTYLTQIAHEEQTPHFPDIEILPNLHPRAATPRRTIRRATRPTLQPLLPLVDAPAASIGPIISAPTPILTRQRAASLTLRRPTGPTEAAIDQASSRAESRPTTTGRRATEPNISPPAGPDAADSSAEASDNDASNISIKYAIRRAARLTNPTRRTSRISSHGAVKKTAKK
ncbi:hypothetical protein EMCG_06967 [[Emmonsia] crescens]|uniref:ORP1 like protein n=1 Tax=[Emmonsia] crescens TaxID=73230 RepID=A0A0G2I9M7_9EURO|nr:hypothetical protein EMCG_06967 [Emmonsia crescens UAMH 3008]